uniref:SIAH-type domain-containing protein n=1 Tax=Homalodisca liturata TaxID=320908 RepID=A0A1B6HWR5_9HEMI
MIQVLNVVSRLCAHARNGCTKFLDEAGHAEHELYCEWRSVRCMWCQWQGSINQLASHVTINHHGAILANTEGSINIPSRRNNIYFFEIDKVVFCLYVWHKPDYPLCLCLMCYPLSKKDMETVFSINIVNRGLHISQSIHPVSDAVKRDKVFSDPEKCIIVPNYIKEGKASFAYCITPGSIM